MLETYRSLAIIRRFEERLLELREEGLIQGSMHLCNGQEAIPVGACRALQEKDALTATYRGHGWAIARGVPLAHLFAELMGRDSPLCGGRGGSAYFTAPEYGFLGENSIVGGGLPIAGGAALAARFDGSGSVSLCSIGDGATNQGNVHEAWNFAAAYDLPLVTVIENNRYSEMTPIQAMVRVKQLADRAAAYGMPGVTVDGNDVDAVCSAVTEAVDRAREGGGPSIIEAMTERIVGHYTGDVQHYRPAGEIEDAKSREPLVRLRAEIEKTGQTASLEAIEQDVVETIARAVEEAGRYPLPDPASARDHIYAD